MITMYFPLDTQDSLLEELGFTYAQIFTTCGRLHLWLIGKHHLKKVWLKAENKVLIGSLSNSIPNHKKSTLILPEAWQTSL